MRQIRGEMDIAPSRKIPLLLQNARRAMRALVDKHFAYLSRLAGLESREAARRRRSRAGIRHRHRSANSRCSCRWPGLIDPKAEIERLSKRIAKNESDIGKLKAKLGNENFVRNAPPEVVAADRARVAELEAQNAGLAPQLDKVRAPRRKLRQTHRVGGGI